MPTVSLPEKCPGLLKELPHIVKQKNPNSEEHIKIPARNKNRSSADNGHIPDGKVRTKPWPTAWSST